VSSIVWRVRHFGEIDSTNTYVKDVAGDESEGLVALADYQRAGRGRLAREWFSPPRASLLCSILLRTGRGEGQVHLAVACVALATRTALERLSGLRAQLKWPNDLMVGERKLAGVLAEVVADGADLAVVVGLGVNLTHEGPEGDATSVRAETGLTIAPRALLDIVLEELEPRRERLDTPAGCAVLRQEYAGALATLGQTVHVELIDGAVVGRAVDVDDTGRLILDVAGEARAIEVGDVVHLRRRESDAV